MTKFSKQHYFCCLGHFDFENLNLFRISCFEIVLLRAMVSPIMIKIELSVACVGTEMV